MSMQSTFDDVVQTTRTSSYTERVLYKQLITRLWSAQDSRGEISDANFNEIAKDFGLEYPVMPIS